MDLQRLVLCFLAIVFSGCAQNEIAPSQMKETGKRSQQTSRLTELVASLGWDCVSEECRYFWWVGAKGEVVEELTQMGKPATPELILALSDPKRAVPANLILWHIWCPTSDEFPFVINDSQLPFEYQTGKLRWTSSTREKFDIPTEMLKANQDWWRTYVAASDVRKRA
jgi:hypothetical protein